MTALAAGYDLILRDACFWSAHLLQHVLGERTVHQQILTAVRQRQLQAACSAVALRLRAADLSFWRDRRHPSCGGEQRFCFLFSQGTRLKVLSSAGKYRSSGPYLSWSRLCP